MRQTWRRRLAIAAAVGAAGLLAVRLALPSMLRPRIEAALSRAIGAPVEVGKVRVGVMAGRVALEDVEVAAPAGFAKKWFARVGQLSIDVSWLSVLAPRFVVEEIRVDAPELWLERNAEGVSIIDAMFRKPKAAPSPAPEEAPAPSKTPKPEKPRAKREPHPTLIKQVVFDDVDVRLLDSKPGRDAGAARVMLKRLEVLDAPFVAGADTAIYTTQLRIDNLKIQAPTDGYPEDPILWLDQANAWIDLPEAMKGHVVLHALRIERLFLESARDASGQTNSDKAGEILDAIFEQEDEDDDEREKPVAPAAAPQAEAAPAPPSNPSPVVADSEPEPEAASGRKPYRIALVEVKDSSWKRRVWQDGAWREESFGGIHLLVRNLSRPAPTEEPFEVTLEAWPSTPGGFFGLRIAGRNLGNRTPVGRQLDLTMQLDRVPLHVWLWDHISRKDTELPQVESALMTGSIEARLRDVDWAGTGVLQFTDIRVQPDNRSFMDRVRKPAAWPNALRALAERDGRLEFAFEQRRPAYSLFPLLLDIQTAFLEARGRAVAGQ